MTNHLDHIYTADEAADRLRITKRGMIKIARRIGACAHQGGRNYRFSEDDLLAIWREMREPATGSSKPASAETVASSRGVAENLKWLLAKPPSRVDKREMRILQWLANQTSPKSHEEIDRAGVKTIEGLLARGFVKGCGTDSEGLQLVRITPTGRDQIAIFERWQRKRHERRFR